MNRLTKRGIPIAADNKAAVMAKIDAPGKRLPERLDASSLRLARDSQARCMVPG